MIKCIHIVKSEKKVSYVTAWMSSQMSALKPSKNLYAIHIQNSTKTCAIPNESLTNKIILTIFFKYFSYVFSILIVILFNHKGFCNQINFFNPHLGIKVFHVAVPLIPNQHLSPAGLHRENCFDMLYTLKPCCSN